MNVSKVLWSIAYIIFFSILIGAATYNNDMDFQPIIENPISDRDLLEENNKLLNEIKTLLEERSQIPEKAEKQEI